jgi:hypothetical protein
MQVDPERMDRNVSRRLRNAMAFPSVHVVARSAGDEAIHASFVRWIASLRSQ